MILFEDIPVKPLDPQDKDIEDVKNLQTLGPKQRPHTQTKTSVIKCIIASSLTEVEGLKRGNMENTRLTEG